MLIGIDTTCIVWILIVFKFLNICLVMALYYPETKLSGMKHLVGKSVLKFRQLLSAICIIFTIYTAIVALLIFFFGHINILDLISLALLHSLPEDLYLHPLLST